MVKAKGSWVTLNTPSQNSIEYFLPSPNPEVDVDVGLSARNICRHSRTFLFLYKLTDLLHCILLKAIVKVSFMRKHFFFNVEPLVYIYI